MAMRQLDRAAESYGVRWTKVLALAGEMFGKTKGLSISECRQVIERIKGMKR